MLSLHINLEGLKMKSIGFGAECGVNVKRGMNRWMVPYSWVILVYPVFIDFTQQTSISKLIVSTLSIISGENLLFNSPNVF